MFKVNQKVTRLGLTRFLCKEEIQSGLLTDDQLMIPSIIEGRFLEATNLKLRIKWTDELYLNGVVEYAPSEYDSINDDTSIEIIDTSEYNEE